MQVERSVMIDPDFTGICDPLLGVLENWLLFLPHSSKLQVIWTLIGLQMEHDCEYRKRKPLSVVAKMGPSPFLYLYGDDKRAVRHGQILALQGQQQSRWGFLKCRLQHGDAVQI